MLDDWNDVRVFLALMRASNLNEAAVQLRVDRSTISRRVTALEKRLATRLFSRTREGLRPTAAAQRLLPHAEKMAADLLALRAAATEPDARPSGLVRVATTEGMATVLVARGLLSVSDTHPGLAIELLAGNRPVDIARAEADVAVRLSPLKQAALKARCVARNKCGLYASPRYLQSRGLPRSSEDVAGHDVVLPAGELSAMPEAKWLASRKGVRVAFRSNSMPALVAAAADGRGLVALGVGWGDAQPALQRVLVLEHLPSRPIWLVTAGDVRPAVRVVADRIAQLLSKG
jgi:DNA-binding transcriptional LysR family regulator